MVKCLRAHVSLDNKMIKITVVVLCLYNVNFRTEGPSQISTCPQDKNMFLMFEDHPPPPPPISEH